MAQEKINKDPILFGPIHMEYVPLAAINELSQVRTSYNSEALQDLATSIINNPTIEDHPEAISSRDFDLLNPLKVGRHTKKSAARYIQAHGDYYEISVQDRQNVDDLTPLDDDTAIISIAGHRRKRAITLLMRQFNLDPSEVFVAADVRQEIRFVDAQAMQLRENVYDRPPAQDEARAISLFYEDIMHRTGATPSIVHFAAQLGFSETKVRDALSFACLPERIQAFTNDGLLSYTTVRRVKTLQDAYKRYYAHLDDSALIEKNVEHELVTFCNQMVAMELSGNTEQRRARMIENKSKEIFGQAEYQQEGLFFLESATPQIRRQTSSQQLSRLAFNVITHQIRQSELSLDALNELEEALRIAKNLAHSRHTTFDLLDDAS